MLVLNDQYLLSLLEDDVPNGDLTTHSLDIGNQPAHLEFRARQSMTVAAAEEALRLFELAGAHGVLHTPSGSALPPDARILEAHGTAANLHSAWKAAQTLVEWASGIATATASIVAAAGGVAVACTRKTVPGTKALSVKAVLCAGGTMHRMGLSETLLVFAEHRLFLTEPPSQTLARLRRSQPEKKIVVEVATVDEAMVWIDAGADVLQLEKFSLEAVAACRRSIDAPHRSRRPLLAAAGGVRIDNAANYVAAGADFLVTSAPYSAAPKDVQVHFTKSG